MIFVLFLQWFLLLLIFAVAAAAALLTAVAAVKLCCWVGVWSPHTPPVPARHRHPHTVQDYAAMAADYNLLVAERRLCVCVDEEKKVKNIACLLINLFGGKFSQAFRQLKFIKHIISHTYIHTLLLV